MPFSRDAFLDVSIGFLILRPACGDLALAAARPALPMDVARARFGNVGVVLTERAA